MPLTVDWSASPYLITCPQSELTLVSGTKYQITVDYLWQLLRDFSDGAEAVPRPILYTNTAPTASTPRIVEINDDYYQFQFENGSYSVEIISGNTNMRDVEVKNTVSVGTNNTTGFINPTFLEAGLFGGQVTLDVVNGVSLTASGYTPAGGIIGTRSDPVDNVPDAVTIAGNRGLNTIYVVGDVTLDTGDDVTGFSLYGESSMRSHIHINAGAVVTEAAIYDGHVEGTLDDNVLIKNCTVGSLSYFNGSIKECQIEGPITLSGGAQADFLSCYSAVAGQSTPTIDLGGTGQSLTIRRYDGGIKLTNFSTGSPEDHVSIDLVSGQVQVDLTTVTGGNVTVRGTGKCVNAADTTDHLLSGSYGSMTLYNETTSGLMIQELWLLQGLDPDNAMTVTQTTRTAGGISLGIAGDDTSRTVTRT